MLAVYKSTEPDVCSFKSCKCILGGSSISSLKSPAVPLPAPAGCFPTCVQAVTR